MDWMVPTDTPLPRVRLERGYAPLMTHSAWLLGLLAVDSPTVEARVGVRASPKDVRTGPSVEVVVPSASVDHVLARPAEQSVRSTRPVQLVVPDRSVDVLN